MKNKFVCIHGHFYQPPRENPWTGQVEVEESAAPDHDWNQRIYRECYSANFKSPIQSPNGKVLKVVNNYEHISFNFGPTLLSWIEREHPEGYPHIVSADAASRPGRSGHGNAIAQSYNHIILPLANRRDKLTQIRWGIADFECRFNRKPEAMWLPETAVDEETLECLISERLRFVLLAPRQAARVRPLEGAGDWTRVLADSLESRRPYRWLSKENPGRSIDIFFYHDALSRAIAFEGILHDGENFVRRILKAFTDNDEPELVLLATDGESYGHHHHFGNMALAYAVDRLAGMAPAVRLTNLGQYLELFPPKYQADIWPKTAWSCFHGLGRWQDDCGCNSGAHPSWNQKWRRPLREALDWLAGTIDAFYLERASLFFQDPWGARDLYFQHLPNHSDGALNRFLTSARKPLMPSESGEVLRLFDMVRNRLYMFTSDGWFFDEISGIEPVQILKYAARAIEIAVSLGIPAGQNLEDQFVRRLASAPSNLPEFGDGAQVYRRLVAPLRDKAAIAAK